MCDVPDLPADRVWVLQHVDTADGQALVDIMTAGEACVQHLNKF
jgi:hypothetical protein